MGRLPGKCRKGSDLATCDGAECFWHLTLAREVAMLFICVTHAEARNTKTEGIPDSVRALTDNGRGQVKQLATFFKSSLSEIAPELCNKEILVDKIVSSPFTRC